MKKEFKQALIIGGSSGIGEALVRRLASGGCRVAALGRREKELERIAADFEKGRVLTWKHDVTATAEIPGLLQEIARELGGLDLVIYNSGIMRPTAFDEYNAEKDLEMIQVNFAGAVAWLDAVGDRFNTTGRGTLVGISSVAGDRGRSGNPVYGATKAAMDTYLEGLRNRLARKGIHVLTIKPGFIDTAMIRGLAKTFWVISPDRAAEIILSRARRRTQIAYVPARWRVLMFVVRHIPSVIFRRLKV